MAVLFFVFRRIKRNFIISLIITAIITALAFFSCVYTDNILIKQDKIEEIRDTLPVNVVVSNIQGTQTDNLGIPGYYADLFISEKYAYQGVFESIPFSSYVKNVNIKSTLFYAEVPPESEEPGSFDNSKKLIGITSVSSSKELDPTEGTVITFFDGCDSSFLMTEERWCIVSKKLFDSLSSDEDEIYDIEISIKTSLHKDENTSAKFKIIGVFSGSSENIYIPWKTASAFQNELDGHHTVDSISATLKENEKIPEFRNLLERHFSLVDPTVNNNDVGQTFVFAATVFDDELNKTIDSLNQSLQILKQLYPIIIFISFAISFLSLFFYIQTRKREVVNLHFLGFSRAELAAILIIENLIYVLLGTLSAIILHSCLSDFSPPYSIIIGIDILAVLGILVSDITIFSKSVMHNIKEAE